MSEQCGFFEIILPRSQDFLFLAVALKAAMLSWAGIAALEGVLCGPPFLTDVSARVPLAPRSLQLQAHLLSPAARLQAT